MRQSTEKIGFFVRRLMAERGITQVELAKKTGLSYRALHDIIKGVSSPRESTLGKLANGLGITLDALLSHDGNGATVETVARDGCIYPVANARPPRMCRTLESAVRIISDAFEMSERDVREQLLAAVVRFKNDEEEEGT